MKFRVTMKTPDALSIAIDDAVEGIIEGFIIDSTPEPESYKKLFKEDIDDIRENRTDQLKQLCEKWFEYDEYLTVEIDTELKTCTVVPVS